MSRTRKLWLALLASFAAVMVAGAPASAQQQQRRPNVIVIFGVPVSALLMMRAA
jgi:hypothetical protein